jgi:hypothetical protein
VVVCAGTSNQYEGEGYDQPFQLPEFQDELIQNISNVKPGRTIVVTNGGGSFDVQPWINQIGALLHASYSGQNGGQALAEILFGTVNPSGKLPFTWEKLITDNPAVATFPMPLNQKAPNPTTISYSEGIFVGYDTISDRGQRNCRFWVYFIALGPPLFALKASFPCVRRNSAARWQSLGSFGSRSSEYRRRKSARTGLTRRKQNDRNRAASNLAIDSCLPT